MRCNDRAAAVARLRRLVRRGDPGVATLQPVWLTTAEENPNGAQVRFLAGGAKVSRYDDVARTAYFIDGGDAEAIEQARLLWKEARDGGHAVSYWQQDGEGRWRRLVSVILDGLRQSTAQPAPSGPTTHLSE